MNNKKSAYNNIYYKKAPKKQYQATRKNTMKTIEKKYCKELKSILKIIKMI